MALLVPFLNWSCGKEAKFLINVHFLFCFPTTVVSE